ncbi:MAG: tetratricopeptide repeat protein [Thermodesulfobacteriota bacterium]
MNRAAKILVAVISGVCGVVPVSPDRVHAHGAGEPHHAEAVSAISPPVSATSSPVVEVSVLPTWMRYSMSGSRDLTGFPVDEAKMNRELSRLAEKLRPAVAKADGGPDVVEAFRRVLLKDEGFKYDRVAGNPENFLIGGVIARKRGNCLGLSLLWVSLAERLGLPFRGVYVPGHCFVRYDGDDARINVEFSEAGAAWEDARYLEEFRMARPGPYLRSLTTAEMLGVFMKSVGAAYAKKGRHEEALVIYSEGARLYPGLPESWYNAGVSLQRMGRSGEAILKYRKALELDPDMAVARGNLGILLANQGLYAEAIDEARRAVEIDPWNASVRGSLASAHCACGDFDEGIREYRKALEIDPSNVQARAGLTRALYAKGDLVGAARECERAEALGCRFEPWLLEALKPYR